MKIKASLSLPTMLLLNPHPPQPEPISIALLYAFINFMQLVEMPSSDMKKIWCQSRNVCFQPLFKIKLSHSLVAIQFNLVSFRTWASNHTNLHDHHCLNRPLSSL